MNHHQHRSLLRGGNSRFNASIWLAIALSFLCGAAAVKAGNFTKQAARVARVEFDPQYDSLGNVTSVPVRIQMVIRVVNDNDASDVRGGNDFKEVDFDLLTIGNTAAAGKTVNGLQAAALLNQMAVDQATAKGIQ